MEKDLLSAKLLFFQYSPIKSRNGQLTKCNLAHCISTYAILCSYTLIIMLKLTSLVDEHKLMFPWYEQYCRNTSRHFNLPA